MTNKNVQRTGAGDQGLSVSRCVWPVGVNRPLCCINLIIPKVLVRKENIILYCQYFFSCLFSDCLTPESKQTRTVKIVSVPQSTLFILYDFSPKNSSKGIHKECV